MALIQQRRAQAMEETLFVICRNSSNTVLSAGYAVCFATLNNASANGYDVEQAATSNLPAFAGIVAVGETIQTQGYGLVQVYGFHQGAYIRHESNEATDPAEGRIYGPVAGQWYLASNGESFAFGPAVLMSRMQLGTFENQTKVLVRAL